MTDIKNSADTLSPAATRVAASIESMTREQVASLSKEEALDVLEILRERLRTIATEIDS